MYFTLCRLGAHLQARVGIPGQFLKTDARPVTFWLRFMKRDYPRSFAWT